MLQQLRFSATGNHRNTPCCLSLCRDEYYLSILKLIFVGCFFTLTHSCRAVSCNNNNNNRYLVGHSRSDILLESKMAASRQFLVRVMSSPSSSSTSSLDLDPDEEGEDECRSKDARRGKILEYWWSLSRCKSGEFTGSYMVDFVLPNEM